MPAITGKKKVAKMFLVIKSEALGEWKPQVTVQATSVQHSSLCAFNAHFLKVFEKSGYATSKWIRYITNFEVVF